MKKKEPVQLSFINALLKDEKKETVLIDTALSQFKNAKWLRSRIQYSNATKKEKLYCHTHISEALDNASKLLFDLSRRTSTYKHLTIEDFMIMLFIDKEGLYMNEPQKLSEIREHHKNVENGIIGMFLAYQDILKKHIKRVNLIIDSITASSRLIQRLKDDVV